MHLAVDEIQDDIPVVRSLAIHDGEEFHVRESGEHGVGGSVGRRAARSNPPVQRLRAGGAPARAMRAAGLPDVAAAGLGGSE